MDLPEFVSLPRIAIGLGVLTVSSFFCLLIVANMTNRNGIARLQTLNQEIESSNQKIRDLDYTIATFSSLVRIEQRARELGFEPAKKVEFLK